MYARKDQVHDFNTHLCYIDEPYRHVLFKSFDQYKFDHTCGIMTSNVCATVKTDGATCASAVCTNDEKKLPEHIYCTDMFNKRR